ncbi:MAG: carbohydrate ABC transporter permease [Dermatophilaceae bacterium]
MSTATKGVPDRTTSRPPRKPKEVSSVAVVTAMIFLVVMAIYFLLPVYWLVINSTKTQSDLVTTNGFWFSGWALGDNLSALFSRDGGVFLRWALNSVIYAGLGAAIGTLLAAMAGYALAKYQFRGREFIFSVILGGVLVPATALALALFLLFAKVSQTDTMWAVFLPSIVSPFGVYLSRIFAASAVPDEIIEAARIDGAGERRIFFGIATPLMMPALVTIFLFQFIAIWNNFLLPRIMLNDSKLYPLTYGLFYWQTQISRDPQLQTLVIVGSLVSVVPLIAVFLSLQRFWQAGLAAGSVK